MNIALDSNISAVDYNGINIDAVKFNGVEVWRKSTGGWAAFRGLVRSGRASTMYPIGTILYDDWGNAQTTAFEIVGYDKHFDSDLTAQGYTHSATLQELKLDIMQFDNEEAWLYVETEIPIGTYKFKIPNYNATYGGNKVYYFTSTASVPVGGQLTLTWPSNSNPTKVQAYDSVGSTNTIFDVNIQEWVSGSSPDAVDLGVIKMSMSDTESNYGKLNHINRVIKGSNNYWQSGLRQLLNSSSAANTWWNPTTIFDRPYGDKSNAGYLTTLSTDFKNVLATPDITDISNNTFETTGLDGKSFSLNTNYTIKDKIFLLSHTEVNISTTSAPMVGSVVDYYNGANNNKRIKYRKDSGAAYYWYLRTPSNTLTSHEQIVMSTGGNGSFYATSNYGVAPACVIQ